jgi:Transposase IS66 family
MRPAGGPAARVARCGPRPLRAAAFFQIAEHCNREQFDALIGPYPGIVVSDRWNGYSHLDPNQRQVCWSHLQRDFRRHADGLAEQKTFGEQASSSPAGCLPRGAPTSTSTTTARG